MTLLESDIEKAALDWFQQIGFAITHGPLVAPRESAAERDSYGDVVLVDRLRQAIERLNPAIAADVWRIPTRGDCCGTGDEGSSKRDD